MAADSQWALQAAIYAALRADAGLIALAGDGASPPQTRVHDDVPEGAAFPYLVVGESAGADYDTKTSDGMVQTIEVHTWSRYPGRKETKDIMEAVTAALDNAGLTVAGHTLVNLRFEFGDSFVDADGKTRHGVQRFRAVTQGS